MSAEMNTAQQLKQAQEAYDSLSQKTAAYIELTQPALDKLAAFNTAFEKRAAATAAVLVERGIIAATEAGELASKLAADKLLTLDLVTKLARMVGANTLGKAAADSPVRPRPRKLDAFEALVLYGDPSQTNPADPLAVD